MPHIKPLGLADDPASSLGTRIYDELAGRTLPIDQYSAWQVIQKNNQ